MTDTDPPLPAGEDRDLLAAELALGVLEGDEHRQALALCHADPAFAAAVAEWRDRLAPLFNQVEPVAAGPVATLPPASQTPPAAAARGWRIATFATGAIAAGLALVLALRPLPAPPPAVLVQAGPAAVAQLTGVKGAPVLTASWDAQAGALRLRPAAIPDERRAPELWVIPADGTPRSLGLIAAHGVSRVALDPALRALIAEGATLAITLEDRAGAPHKAPSSTPIAAGTISRI